ncbi:ATP-binding response regulator [Parafilimonas sp.]|uniref:ATP-binding response regulator n=1 Tax=Parafilimonas sp. TaxID=1969739 RepID=UPI003F8191DD
MSIEIVIFFYLLIFRLARPHDKITNLNLILIFLLLAYNVSGGLLPDEKLPGSYFTQEIIAYATGFITPCFFPYYVYKAFNLYKMEFHAHKGIFIFLIFPYILFVLTFWYSNDLKYAQNLLVVPVLYAAWVIISLIKAIRYKYNNDFSSTEAKQETVVLLFSITPWIGLPIITYFEMGQAIEAVVTNVGFLLLFGLQVNRDIIQMRIEHEQLIDSERLLRSWNTDLKEEVEKRTKELERINEQKVNNFINLVHETKTPLTLIKNYLEEYIGKYGSVQELDIIKGGVDKLTADVINLFDIERFAKGIDTYKHNQVSDFSALLKSSLPLFGHYCDKQKIKCTLAIEDKLLIKADPFAINRIVNNIIENAIKFTNEGGEIAISLHSQDGTVVFAVKDTGEGIMPNLQKKIFEPYYQIGHKHTRLQGMGLGLPIVKKVVDGLGGKIEIESNPATEPGTRVTIILPAYTLQENEVPIQFVSGLSKLNYEFNYDYVKEHEFIPGKRTLLLVEDNITMINFLFNKLSELYNVLCASNGSEALKKLYAMKLMPDLILSDVMMDKMDGFTFARTLSEQDKYAHIPIIFLSAKSSQVDRMKGLKVGAIDFISKPFSFEELNQKIETVLANVARQHKAILSSSIASLKALNNQEADDGNISQSKFEQNCKLFQFTTREIEIAHLITKGKTYKEIAKQLFISDKTVTKHIQNIFEKAEVSNKVSLINKLKAA